MSISAYALGQEVRLTATFANLSGVDTNATVALTIRTPDGVETAIASGSIVNDSAGVYHYDYTTTQSGAHFARWVASGTLVGAQEYEFYVLRQEA